MPAIGHVMEVTGFGTDAVPRMIAPQRVEPAIRLDAAGGAKATDEVSEGGLEAAQ
jgi:hypothetical protein